MIIELIGSTGSGKTTLANEILLAFQEKEFSIITETEFVLKQVYLSWVKSNFGRTVLIDLFSMIACIATLHNNVSYYGFAFQIVTKLKINFFEKLNLCRNILKKCGTYEIVRHFCPNQKIVIFDEGTLHTAHNLFVHISQPSKKNDIEKFLKIVSLPDIAICISENEDIIIRRTIVRGHKRIPGNKFINTKIFVKRALKTFKRVVNILVKEKKMFIRYNDQKFLIVSNNNANPILEQLIMVFKEKEATKS